MSRKYFGTDGIRGVANLKLTPELAFSVGQAAGRYLLETGQPRRVVLGRDTRRSGPMLGAALAAGFCSVGIDVVSVGVAPTPTVSFLARTQGFGLGCIISASHNPAPDNGIKFVGFDGRKLTDSVEAKIETLMSAPEIRPTGASVGDLQVERERVSDYVEMLMAINPNGLKLKVAVDGANGAAYALGRDVLERLGATVVATGDEPDGMNINASGGATKPETILALTVAEGCDVGVAFDGDADRVIFSDEKGQLINGDGTMAAWAVATKAAGKLDPPVVVGTVMSNGGVEKYLAENNIRLERTNVGDKYVAQSIDALGALVGGEQSGHIIYPKNGPTGDGLATMLEFLKVLVESGKKTSEFAQAYEPWPQILVNVTVDKMAGWAEDERVSKALNLAKTSLGTEGRVVVRASGTQPMIRVMVEATTYERRDAICDGIVNEMLASLGGSVYSRVDLTHALGD